MQLYFAASTRGFYDSEIHGADIPSDAVPITAAQHVALINGEVQGKVISADESGMPLLVDRPVPDPAEVMAAWRAAAKVSRFQARAALHAAGLLPAVESAVAAGDAIVQIAWADAAEFRRSSPTIAALAIAIGLTDEQVDDLFRQAAQITA